MARCQCGSTGDCNCVVIAGNNTTVTGTGSAVNPYVVNAIIDCDEVRACLSEGPGVDFNAGTGVIQACLSTDVGNNITFGTDNCLFVPTGAATVSTDCGILGNGAVGTPVRANTGVWPFACDQDVNGREIYCRPSDGRLITDPPVQAAVYSLFTGQTYADLLVPAAPATTIFSTSLNIINTDPCRSQVWFAVVTTDVDFRIPPNGSAAARTNNDRSFVFRHAGSTDDIGNISIQTPTTFTGTVGPGAVVNFPIDIQLGEGSGGATYDAISVGVRAALIGLA